MKMKMLKSALLVLLAGAVMTSCKKDEVEVNQEEVITTLKMTFTPVGGGTALVYQYDDADGPGGAAAVKNEIVLAPSRVYNVSVELLNKTASPVADLTQEVKDEADAHRFYYEPAAGSNITVSNLDNDRNGVPLGITSTWTTGAAANGTIKVTLRHYAGNPPNKAAADPVNSTKSDTDIEVEFNTKVQ